MANSRLQIKLLSKNGEVLNCVNCFSGQITVLRANDDSDLIPYSQALAGIVGSKRFAINLDNQDFIPNQHTLVGYGEQLAQNVRVSDLLVDSGIAHLSIDLALSNYGLSEVASKHVEQLTPCEHRRLQILLATYSLNLVLILNDPFEPISIAWRDKIAARLLEDATTKGRITVIPSLTYRPKNWVGNETVVRIQVGEAIQKTIGFTSQSDEVKAAIETVRSMVKEEKDLEQILGLKTQNNKSINALPNPDTEIKKISNKPLIYLSSVLALILIALLLRQENVAPSIQKETTKTNAASNNQPQIKKNQSHTVANNNSTIKNEPTLIPTATPVQFLLDNYNPEIKSAIIDGYNSNQINNKKPPKVNNNPQTEDFADLLRSIPSNNEQTIQPGSQNQPVPIIPSDDEAQREIIRQRFLEAINKAVQQRQEQEP